MADRNYYMRVYVVCVVTSRSPESWMRLLYTFFFVTRVLVTTICSFRLPLEFGKFMFFFTESEIE